MCVCVCVYEQRYCILKIRNQWPVSCFYMPPCTYFEYLATIGEIGDLNLAIETREVLEGTSDIGLWVHPNSR